MDIDLERIKKLSGIVDRTMNDAGRLDFANRNIEKFIAMVDGLVLDLANDLEKLNAIEGTVLPDEAQKMIANRIKQLENISDKINQEFY